MFGRHLLISALLLRISEPEDAVPLRVKTPFGVVEAVGALANQLGSARTDDHTLPSWKTAVAFPPGIALKGRNEVHVSGAVLRTLWGQIKDTQQGVCVLVSLGGRMSRSRKIC